ncbi:hypothetical protein [uncultured Lamprocystis sp.]|jgi:hypothetical protein|uniref:HEAT repeat domain-containing protein n=1 Tax=uncultured Lamprocystis sp. TaxID=543132 RepID=UPI0025ED254D|nr:hypothetical protein [uncultured Lamprocystis sp.]
MPKRRTIAPETGLAELRETIAAGTAPVAALRTALADPNYRLVALAAGHAGDQLIYPLEADLIAAFRRLAARSHTQDPQCTAKGAITRALVALDCVDVTFFLTGIRYRQLEPTWGGSQDTAVDLRVTAAMGLAATAYARALPELTRLLVDPEPRVRAGVMDAIACCEPIAAESVLRTKAQAGDGEPEVTGACLLALLRLDPEATARFVGSFLDRGDPILRDAAALALGESRVPAALVELRTRWDAAPYKGAAEQVLLKGALLHRSDQAFDWLLLLVADGERRISERLVKDLTVYRGNQRLRRRLADALTGRGDAELVVLLNRVWPETS